MRSFHLINRLFAVAVTAAAAAGIAVPSASARSPAVPDLRPPQEALVQLSRTAPQPACPGAFAPIGFSVYDLNNLSSGNNSVLPYNNVTTNVGGGWQLGPNATTFTAPCPGLYIFAVAFERDAFGLCGGTLGTTDDVTMYVLMDGNPILNSQAWAGESNAKRAEAAATVVLHLAAGDVVQSWVHSDGGLPRCLALYEFSGARVNGF